MTKDAASGELVHDDDLMTWAMGTRLDRMEWRVSLPTTWTTPSGILKEKEFNTKGTIPRESTAGQADTTEKERKKKTRNKKQ